MAQGPEGQSLSAPAIRKGRRFAIPARAQDKMERYAVFIDGGYLKKVLKKFDPQRIDYLKLSEYVADGDTRLRTYYYGCPPYVAPTKPTPEEKQRQSGFDRFKRALENYPRFQVRLGRLQRIDTTSGPMFTQKKVDILLSLDLVKLAVEHQIQRAVIFAGDGDFEPAILMAKDAGTVVQICYVPGSAHDELLNACDERIVINQAFVDAVLMDEIGGAS